VRHPPGRPALHELGEILEQNRREIAVGHPWNYDQFNPDRKAAGVKFATYQTRSIASSRLAGR
jgi:hypothetical protein